METPNYLDLGTGWLFDHLQDAVIVVELEAEQIVLWSPSAEQFFGWSRAQALHEPIAWLIPELVNTREWMTLAEGKGQTPLSESSSVELLALTKDGQEIWIVATLSRLANKNEGRDFVLLVARSANQTRRVEEALSQWRLQHAALAQLGQRALQGMEVPLLLNEAVAVVALTLRVEFVKMLELLPGGEAMLLRSGLGWPEGLVGQATVSAGPDSHAGYTLQARGPVLVTDLSNESRFRGSPLLHEYGLVSGLSVAIGKRSCPYGVLAAHTRRHREFTSQDANFLEAVANVLATAIERKQTEEALRKEVAQRTEAEQALRQTNQAFRTVIDTAPMAIVALDLNRNVAAWNPGAERLFGWNQKEVLGKPIPLIPGNDEQRLAPNLSAAQEKGERTVGLEVVRQRKDGSLVEVSIWTEPIFNEADAVVGSISMMADNTDRKRAENEHARLLQEQVARAEAEASERRAAFLSEASALLSASLDYRATIQSVARLSVPAFADLCAVDMLDEQEGTVTLLAAAHVDAAKEERFREVRRRYPPDPTRPHPVWEVIRTGRALFRPERTVQEVQAYAHDAEHLGSLLRTVVESSTIHAPLTSSGQVLGVLTWIVYSPRRFGVAERGLVEELARRCAHAIHNSRQHQQLQETVRERERFLSIAAHELRTPAAVLKGRTEMLLMMASDEDLSRTDLVRSLQRLDKASDRLAAQIRALLDSSQVRKGQLTLRRQRVSFTALVRTLVKEYQRELRVPHHIVLAVPEESPHISLDITRVRQVCTNLLDNAIKFSPDGGEIHVKIQHAEDAVLLTVQDQGIGLPLESLEHIFEPFSRAGNAEDLHVGGLGLGLHVCRNIVEQHGGLIWAESEGPGRGVSVSVRLPLQAVRRDGARKARARIALRSG